MANDSWAKSLQQSPSVGSSYETESDGLVWVPVGPRAGWSWGGLDILEFINFLQHVVCLDTVFLWIVSAETICCCCCTVYISHYGSVWNIFTRAQVPVIVIAKEEI